MKSIEQKRTQNDKSLLQTLRDLDIRYDYIRLPENEVIVQGKPLAQWLKERGGPEKAAKYLLVFQFP